VVEEESEVVGDGGAPEHLVGLDLPLAVDELVEGDLLLEDEDVGEGEGEGVEEEPEELQVAALAVREEGLLLVPGDHGLAHFVVLVELVVLGLAVGLALELLQVEVFVVEVDALLDELLDADVGFDEGAAVGVEVAHVGHRDI